MNSLLKVYWNLMFNLTGWDLSFDAEYEDFSFFGIELRAKVEELRCFLAARHLVPKESAPGKTRLQIVGCEMRKVRIAGAYNEVAIQVPVEPLEGSPDDRVAHLFLPVTTEAARWPGVDIYGFPKFIAKIDIVKEEAQIICRLAADGEQILEFEMPDKTGPKKQAKWEFYGNRKKQMVKVVFDWEGYFLEETGGDVRFVLGKHPIAETIGRLLISGEVVRTSIGHNVSGILRKPVPIENQ
jgi:hypothetical protein